MNRPTKTEIVFEDLHQLSIDINTRRRNPRIFRLAFESYIFKSQQLTEAMRSEYKQQTGRVWCASHFEGWNEYTNTIKKLRNTALHGYPIVLDESVLSIYRNVRFATDTEENISNKKYRATTGRCFIQNPYAEKFTSIGVGHLREERASNNPNNIDSYAFPIKEYVFYELRWDLMGLVFSDIDGGRIDAVKLVLKTFPRFERYMTYYKSEREKNLLDAYKSDFWVRAEKGHGRVINPKYRINNYSHS